MIAARAVRMALGDDISRCPEDGSALLPGAEGGPVAVLFWRRARSGDATRRRFDAMTWPRGYRACVLDVDCAGEVMAFFGIRVDDDAMAVIDDGVVLALEYACDDDAQRRLLAIAERSRRFVPEL